jgi:hypothetical protein
VRLHTHIHTHLSDRHLSDRRHPIIMPRFALNVILDEKFHQTDEGRRAFVLE